MTPSQAPGSDRPDGSERPVLRVVSGNPTPEEIAALVAVLTAASGSDAGRTHGPRSAWADPHWRLTGSYAGRGGWRRSALPH